jgi:hypothetical protein
VLKGSELSGESATLYTLRVGYGDASSSTFTGVNFAVLVILARSIVILPELPNPT